MSWTKKATEQYKSDLHKYRNNHELHRRLDKTMEKIMENPKHSGKMMSGEAHPSRNIRVTDDFRILFKVKEEEKEVILQRLYKKG